VILAANIYQRFMPMLMTAAGTVKRRAAGARAASPASSDRHAQASRCVIEAPTYVRR